VIARAREVLANLESGELDLLGQPMLARGKRGVRGRSGGQQDLFGAPAGPDPLVERLAGIDANRLTPIEALQALSDLVEQAKRKVNG
jgi:DNA mismatch repair protein MutS